MNTKKFIKDAVCDNFDHKGEILNNIMSDTRKSGRSTHSRPVRLIAVIAAVVLTMCMTVAAVVLSRSVELSLTTDKDTVFNGDKVCVTATAKNMTDFVDGIYGFTVDVNFDNTRFDFDSDFGVEKAEGIGDNFTAVANLSDQDTVTVLFYANVTSDDLSFIDKNVADVFKLCFTVKNDAQPTTDGTAFTLTDCKVADASADGESFELVENVTLTEAKINVAAIQLGDVNGDGTINLKDLVRFKKYVVGMDVDFFELAADCDKNGAFEPAADIISLVDLILDVLF